MNKDMIYPSMVIRSQSETIELQSKEIERLKELIDSDNENYDIQEKIIDRQKSEIIELEDYKSRCKKAIDKLKRDYYIKKVEHNDNVIDEVLNILQNGGDNK